MAQIRQVAQIRALKDIYIYSLFIVCCLYVIICLSLVDLRGVPNAVIVHCLRRLREPPWLAERFPPWSTVPWISKVPHYREPPGCIQGALAWFTASLPWSKFSKGVNFRKNNSANIILYIYWSRELKRRGSLLQWNQIVKIWLRCMQSPLPWTNLVHGQIYVRPKLVINTVNHGDQPTEIKLVHQG